MELRLARVESLPANLCSIRASSDDQSKNLGCVVKAKNAALCRSRSEVLSSAGNAA